LCPSIFLFLKFSASCLIFSQTDGSYAGALFKLAAIVGNASLGGFRYFFCSDEDYKNPTEVDGLILVVEVSL